MFSAGFDAQAATILILCILWSYTRLLEELHADVSVVFMGAPHLFHVFDGLHRLALQQADLFVARHAIAIATTHAAVPRHVTETSEKQQQQQQQPHCCDTCAPGMMRWLVSIKLLLVCFTIQKKKKTRVRIKLVCSTSKMRGQARLLVHVKRAYLVRHRVYLLLDFETSIRYTLILEVYVCAKYVYSRKYLRSLPSSTTKQYKPLGQRFIAPRPRSAKHNTWPLIHSFSKMGFRPYNLFTLPDPSKKNFTRYLIL